MRSPAQLGPCVRRRMVVGVRPPARRRPWPTGSRSPKREHHLMQVDITFPDVPTGPLQVRMSRSSPGRYSIHEFAKNVFDVRITDECGKAADRLPAQSSRVGRHRSLRAPCGCSTASLVIDVDGTYLAIDCTHAHINMPAAMMWARGIERRTMTIRFERPPGTSWSVATQLMPGQRLLFVHARPICSI